MSIVSFHDFLWFLFCFVMLSLTDKYFMLLLAYYTHALMMDYVFVADCLFTIFPQQ